MDYDKTYKFREIEKIGKRARGGKELRRHLSGARLTRAQAILAACYDCSGYYSDGRADCDMPDCPLYGYMPYKSKLK